MSYRKTIGFNIRRIRNQRGLTQEALAAKSKLSYEFVNRLENGRVNVSIDALERIAKSLKVRLNDFLEENS
jgi:transcriptional regulator with XRE-family HTH domain